MTKQRQKTKTFGVPPAGISKLMAIGLSAKTSQWTKYEVKPEFRGNKTLLVWQETDGHRDYQYCTPAELKETLGTGINEGYTNQRVYAGVNEDAIEEVISSIFRSSEGGDMPFQLIHLSNQALDELILQHKQEKQTKK